MRLVPVYSVYRCHNCNWRGWLRRSNATNVKVALVVAFYAIVGVAVIAGTVVAIQRLWPSPEYEYSE